MKIFKILRKLLHTDRRTLLMFVEACLLLGWARCQLFRPFAAIAPKLGERTRETSLDYDPPCMPAIRQVAHAINTVSRHTPWESKCLVRAIAGMKMLERRRIDSTLYMGTAKDKTGQLIAHAWLRSGPVYITGAEVMNRFIVVQKFAKAGRNC
ncbi:lasso peptide biosynthesis B2 protein [Paenibacillus sepulcri]